MILLNIEMPKSCGECRFYREDLQKCLVLDYELRTDQYINKSACPLEELPTPHGRLIDGDKLADDLEWDAQRADDSLKDLDLFSNEYTYKRIEKDTKLNAAWWIRDEADKHCFITPEQ